MNVSFADISIEVTEGVGIVDFMLQKTAGALGPVSVQIFTSDGTALGTNTYSLTCVLGAEFCSYGLKGCTIECTCEWRLKGKPVYAELMTVTESHGPTLT